MDTQFSFIGMDEAAYGPNLGPLVIAATRWGLPEPALSCNFFERLSDVVSQTASLGKLQIADSKVVHKSSQGLLALERSVLPILYGFGKRVTSFTELWGAVSQDAFPSEIPWFQETSLELPVELSREELETSTVRFMAACRREGIELTQLLTRIIPANRFNALLQQHEGKGQLLTRQAFDLLTHIWQPDEQVPICIIGDKHGGRSRYDQILSEYLDGQMILRFEEGRELSRYRVNNTEIRFQTKAEAHFPVAVASIIAKYVREVAMLLFNRFWLQHIPDLKPTKGYPVDALRFRECIRETQAKLGIAEDTIWRQR